MGLGRREKSLGFARHYWLWKTIGRNCNLKISPISFSEEYRKLHGEEMENHDYIERLMEEFQDAGILPLDGIVDPEDYEIVQKINQMQKGKLMSLAENEEQRVWMDKIWPYQDRPEEA